jgi:hypothetical protein
MLETSTGANQKATPHANVELSFHRLAALLLQQERLLERSLCDVDFYLYDLRADEISALIANIESDRVFSRATRSFSHAALSQLSQA